MNKKTDVFLEIEKYAGQRQKEKFVRYLVICRGREYPVNHKVPNDWKEDEGVKKEENVALLRLVHQCAHRLSASEKYRGQGRLLNLLRERGTLTQRELIELTGRRSATLSEQLEKMEKSGYLTRQKNQQDRRNVDVTLTDLGREAALEARADRERRAEVFDGLTPREREELTALLEKLLALCEAREAGGGEGRP